ncbi:MAG: apolipoprotein A1/A4/E family protein [Pyrinomonadaceae bacterium]|nr:apolipoprotein A1/A4/E family protein [Pyrinomonadaceae bacterium]
MATVKERLEELRRNAEDKVRELDEKFNLREKFEEAGRIAADVARTSAENVRDNVEKLRNEADRMRVEAENLAGNNELSEQARKVAAETATKAREVTENLRQTAESVGAKVQANLETTFGGTLAQSSERAGVILNDARIRAEDFFGSARTSFETAANNASNAFNFSVSWSRIMNSSVKTVNKAFSWTKENPSRAVITGFSLIFGVRLGSAMPFLSSHWLFNSALPVYGLRKASEQFENYLKQREELIKFNQLSEAETERVKFERDIVKYVGAPLLGAFSFATGAVLWSNIFSPKTITGAPISWLLGGNPFLEGVWLFGNGVICFQIGYDFFMIALDDNADVQRIVKEIKGLLPSS